MKTNNNANKEIPDGWSPDEQTLIHYGMGYRLKKDLTQVCVGPVDQDGQPINPISKAVEALPDNKEDVSKIKDDIIIAPVIMKQPKSGRGRPKKLGSVLSRVTLWRRKKELQGVLL